MSEAMQAPAPCPNCGRDPIYCEVALALHAGLTWDVFAEHDCERAAREALRATALEGLHELAWMAVLAGQSDEQSGRVLQPPLVGELVRRQLATRAIALIEALR